MLTIAIATHGRPALLRRTLENLSSVIPNGAPCRIVVAENGGRCGAEAVARAITDPCELNYLYLPQPNKCAALNAIIKAAPPGLIWFLDDDVTVLPETVEAYLRASHAEEDRYFGGPLEPEFEEPPPDWLLPYLPRSARGWHFIGDDVSQSEVTFLGANWAAFPSALRAVGGYCEEFGPGTHAVGGETEIQLRLRAAGFRPTYLPQALVRHWVPRDRCTPRWALDRAYRIGVSEGLMHARDGTMPQKLLLGYPRWMWPEWLRRWWGKCWAARSRDPAVRFAAAREEAFFRGMMAGHREARGSNSAKASSSRKTWHGASTEDACLARRGSSSDGR